MRWEGGRGEITQDDTKVKRVHAPNRFTNNLDNFSFSLVSLVLEIFSSMLLQSSDNARDSSSRKTRARGNYLALPVVSYPAI
jgi:cytosine/uracil/thiamine/allantoin permease